ncbi:MAG: alanine racemase [Pseudomonadota bacterium]|nr:alanine racemase [Pseudomonadota bacterium]
MQLSEIAEADLPPGTKALPLDGSIARLADLTGRGLNLLRGDLPMPVAVLKHSALDNNLRSMQAYIERVGVKLAPHAKTTMCPQLFARQLAQGAWGLSVATMTQFKLCHDLGNAIGLKRLILANQLVGSAEIIGLARLWAQTPERAYYVLVDGLAGARAISEGFGKCPGAPAARLLIEMGMPHARCGVRTVEEGQALARAILSLPNVELHGVEGYEGLIVSDHAGHDASAVVNYLHTVVRLCKALAAEQLFAAPEQIIVSAGGSAYYDLVVHVLSGNAPGVVPILRSGCYVTHDSGFYHRLLTRIQLRGIERPAPHLVPALEVWSRVISRPEPDRAIVMMGKRDVSYDIDLPMVRWWFREGRHHVPASIDGLSVDKLNDQHAYLSVPGNADLQVGDLLGFHISHPCTTFDKWSLLMEVDDGYTVIGGLKTFF